MVLFVNIDTFFHCIPDFFHYIMRWRSRANATRIYLSRIVYRKSGKYH